MDYITQDEQNFADDVKSDKEWLEELACAKRMLSRANSCESFLECLKLHETARAWMLDIDRRWREARNRRIQKSAA